MPAKSTDPSAYASGPVYQRSWDRMSQYAPQIGAFICERIEAGETVADICRQATMPSRATIYVWAKTIAEFAGMFDAARQAARQVRIDEETSHLETRRQRNGQARARRGVRGSSYTDAVGEAVCERLAAGEPLSAIGADPAMPSRSTLFNWLREHPDFRDMYRLARLQQAETHVELAWEIARAATPRTAGVAALQIRVLRWQASLLTPKKYG